jgi:hypothetical protein
MTTFASQAFRSFLFGSIVLGAGALGCSTSAATGTGTAACVALTACCAGMSATAEGDCLTIASLNSEATCTTTLTAYQQGSRCGGGTGPGDAGHITTGDTGLPCELTNTCTATKDGGGSSDTGLLGGCQTIGSCSDGQTYKECTTTSGGACSASFVFSGGATFTCASCSDCASALTSAQSMCGTTVTTGDAGHDAGNTCGTPPVLHPETAAGVYCPFTAAGSVHCTAGQECCEAPSTSANGSTCEAAGTTCPITGSISWACDGPVDCAASAAGPVCCAAGTVSLDSTCGFNRGSGFTSSHCASSCVGSEISICSEATDPCSSGTCTAFKVAGIVIGTCQ